MANHGLAAGKAGLVTGAGSGIGRASALLFGAEGMEYVSDGIRVNAICPGATLTGMMLHNSGTDDDSLRRIAASQPGGRIAAPFEEAEAAVWLCSDRASFVTGVAFPVDNGATLGGTMSHTNRAARS